MDADDIREQRRSRKMSYDDPAQEVVDLKQGAARLQELLGNAAPYDAQLDEVDKIGLNMLRSISRIAAWSDSTRAKLHTERNKL
jgi:hypothetical protein